MLEKLLLSKLNEVTWDYCERCFRLHIGQIIPQNLPSESETKIIFNTSLTHRVYPVPKVRSDIHAVFSQVFCVFMNKVVQKMSVVVILITLSDWFLLPSLFVLCYRLHKNNDTHVPVISKNDVVCISGLRASPGGGEMVDEERECKVIYEVFE